MNPEDLKKADPFVFIQMVHALVARGNRIDTEERVQELLATAHKLAIDTSLYGAQHCARATPPDDGASS